MLYYFQDDRNYEARALSPLTPHPEYSRYVEHEADIEFYNEEDEWEFATVPTKFLSTLTWPTSTDRD